MLQRRQMRAPLSHRVSWVTRPQPGQAGLMMVRAPASHSVSISRSTAGMGAWCPSPVSNPGRSSTAQARRSRTARPGATRSTAVVMVAVSNDGSTPRITPTSRFSGSCESVTGQWVQCGRPWRSRRATWRSYPHETHRCRSPPQGWQYQFCPRRAKLPRSGRRQSVQHGAQIPGASAARNASSNAPTTSGAGERPSVNTAGRSTSASASRRAFARPDATRVTTSRATLGSSPGSARVSSSTVSPTGSATAWARSPASLTARRPWRCGPVSGAAPPTRTARSRCRRRPCGSR